MLTFCLQVHIPLKADHTSKGLAFVLFTNPNDAVAAWEALDGMTFQGRLLHILAGVERRGEAEATNTSKTLKDERAEKRKKDAGKDFNWGMLYMNVRGINYLLWVLADCSLSERCCCIIDSGKTQYT